MKHQVISVTDFKARCLSLLNEIGEHGGTITITKRGRPLATVGPTRRTARKSSEGMWAGKVIITGDLLEDTSHLWEVTRPRKGARG